MSGCCFARSPCAAPSRCGRRAGGSALFFRAARGGSQPSRGGFSSLRAPCPARDRRTWVLEGRRRGGLNRSSKGHSAGCWFVSVQEPGAAAVVGRGGGGALYAPDLPTLGASGREGRSFSLLFGAQPLRGTTLAPACPMRPASRSRHREPSACSRMSHDLLVSHYASSHLSLL